MAVPKRKTSKARKNTRRSAVWKLTAPALAKCPEYRKRLDFRSSPSIFP